MRFKPKIKYGDRQVETSVEVDGVEFDVILNYETSPEERDVNWPGGLDLRAVMLNGFDVIGLMSDSERAAAEQLCEDDMNAYCEMIMEGPDV
jgi:hypothetical protein